MDPIQCDIWEGMVTAMQLALHDVPDDHEHYTQAEQVHEELEKHMQYFKMQGKKKIGNEIMHLQLKAAYKQDRIKLEAMIVPNTPSSSIWQNQICPFSRRRVATKRRAWSQKRLWRGKSKIRLTISQKSMHDEKHAP